MLFNTNFVTMNNFNTFNAVIDQVKSFDNTIESIVAANLTSSLGLIRNSFPYVPTVREIYESLVCSLFTFIEHGHKCILVLSSERSCNSCRH